MNIAPHVLPDLRARLRGQVIYPDQPGYDEARVGFNLTLDQRPALIVLAADAADVAEAVR